MVLWQRELFRSSFGWHCCKWRTSCVMSIKHLWMTSSNFSVNVTAVFVTKRVINSVCSMLISSFVMVSWSYLRSHLSLSVCPSVCDWMHFDYSPCDLGLDSWDTTSNIFMNDRDKDSCLYSEETWDWHTDNEKTVSWFIVIKFCCQNPVIVIGSFALEFFFSFGNANRV